MEEHIDTNKKPFRTGSFFYCFSLLSVFLKKYCFFLELVGIIKRNIRCASASILECKLKGSLFMSKKSKKASGLILAIVLILSLIISITVLADSSISDEGSTGPLGSADMTTVDAGQVSVPYVIGYTEAAACEMLSYAGLSYAVEYVEDNQHIGIVKSQSIGAETLVPIGTAVVIYVGKEAATEPPTETQTPEETTSQEDTTAETTTQKETTTEKETTTKGEEKTTKETTTKKEESSEENSSEENTSKEETTTTQETTTQPTSLTQEITANGLDSYMDVGVVVNDKPEKFGTLYWPLPAEYGPSAISSRYGYRTGQYSGMHRGLDIAAPTGTEIYACLDGVVIASYYSDSAGNFTIIQHTDGIYTEYMHQSVRHVKQGDKVKAGQLIGLVGNTGWSTGPHLHIGVVISDSGYDPSKRVDPLPYLSTDTSLQFGDSDKVIEEKDMIIDYNEGTQFTKAVNARPDLTKNLHPFISSSDIKRTAFSGFTYKGYIGSKGDKLKKKNAVTSVAKPGFNRLTDTWVRYETKDFDIVLTIEATYNSSKKDVPFSTRLDSMVVNMDWSSSRKPDLSEPFFEEIGEDEGEYFAAYVHVDIFDHGTSERTPIREVYQMLKDVDEGQSFRCMNEEYKPEMLFVEDTRKFNKNSNDNDKSVYVKNNGDIYSDFDLDPYEEFASNAQANVYRQTYALEKEGLDLVFGFEHKADASINLYLPKRSVVFKTTEGGICNAIGEIVNKRGKIATTPEVEAKEGYEFKGWITDQDIELNGGKVIRKGETITIEQMSEIVVMNRLSFTAQFEKIAE